MGTRNLTVVKHGGKYVVAQYCQWDGYPKGQGTKALDFMREVSRAEFENALSRCVFIDEATLKERWASAGADGSGWVSLDVSDRMKKLHPQLSRDMGADVLAHIMASTGKCELVDQIDFAKDGLFCEWAYVIDLDAETFEAFKGFNQSPLDETERFYGEAGDNGYTPVKLAGTWALDALPSNEQFVTHLSVEDSDED